MKSAIPVILAVFLLILTGCAQETSTSEDADLMQEEQKEEKEEEEKEEDEEENTYDFAINNMTVSSIDWEVGERVSVYPIIRNPGDSVENLEIRITSNDKTIKTFEESFEKGETRQLTYNWYPEKAGTYNILVRLDPENKFSDIRRENNNINMTIKIKEQ